MGPKQRKSLESIKAMLIIDLVYGGYDLSEVFKGEQT